MAGALRKTMLYLGLAEEDREAGYERGYERAGHPQAHVDEYDEHLDAEEYDVAHEYQAEVTPLRRAPHPAPVAPASELRRITTIHPRSYNDARVIGEAFRSGTPVIMNLSEMTDADAKRLVDFSAGLIFGLHGAIERVTSKVFLLSPENIAVSGHGGIAHADVESAAFDNA